MSARTWCLIGAGVYIALNVFVLAALSMTKTPTPRDLSGADVASNLERGENSLHLVNR